MNKILLIILDGLGGIANNTLGGRTCLEAAQTPLMDRFAQEGACGLIKPFMRKNSFPTSEDTHFSLFGYDAEQYRIGRGVFEAIGLNIKLDENSIAWRGNWATLDDKGHLVDRRAGRIPVNEDLIAGIKHLTIEGVEFDLYLGQEHRSVLLMRGEGLSDKVSDGYSRELGVLPPKITALNEDPKSIFTAKIVNEYLEKIHELLIDNPINKQRIDQGFPPANYILLRGAGSFKKIPSFYELWKRHGACIAGGYLYRGISKMIGWDIIDVPGANASVDTNLSGKIQASIKALEDKDFIFCHIKATDTLGHNHDCKGKVKFLEKIDESLNPIFDLKNITLIITGDHATPCSTGEHEDDLIPLLIWGKGVQSDDAIYFGESACAQGSLGTMEQTQVLSKIMEITK